MTDTDPKKDLHLYLQEAREALVWKLDGLSEYERRRPLTPTGTNLLGLVKHVAATEAGYLGECFGRPFPQALPWMADDAETNQDMWATPDERTADIVRLYHQVWKHSDATIDQLPLDGTGEVPWWGGRTVTLHRILVHLIAETHRHAGQADIVRENIDGAAGLMANNSNLPDEDEQWWQQYRDRVEAAARAADGSTAAPA